MFCCLFFAIARIKGLLVGCVGAVQYVESGLRTGGGLHWQGVIFGGKLVEADHKAGRVTWCTPGRYVQMLIMIDDSTLVSLCSDLILESRHGSTLFHQS